MGDMRCQRVDVPNPNRGDSGFRLSAMGLTSTPMNAALAVVGLAASAILRSGKVAVQSTRTLHVACTLHTRRVGEAGRGARSGPRVPLAPLGAAKPHAGAVLEVRLW